MGLLFSSIRDHIVHDAKHTDIYGDIGKLDIRTGVSSSNLCTTANRTNSDVWGKLTELDVCYEKLKS